MKINYPTAIVLVTFVAAYVVLDAFDHDIPHWLTTILAAMGTGATAAMQRLFPAPSDPPSKESDTDEPPKPSPPSPPEAA